MRPTTADTNVFEFNALIHPGTLFELPGDVVRHSGLTMAEKRLFWLPGHQMLPR